MLGGREVGVAAEDAADGRAGMIELVGGAVQAGKMQDSFVLSGIALKHGLPQFQGFVVVLKAKPL